MRATLYFFFFSSRRRHPRCSRDWSSDVCSSDLQQLLGIREVLSGLSNLRLPLLVLHGAEDRTISPKASEAFFRGASSQDKTLKVFPGLRHEILNDPEKEQVLAVILDWLRRRLA